jgi:hypothetical protein
MGNVLFGVDVAGLIADALGGGLPVATITRAVPGARDPGDLSAGRAAVTESRTCSGFFDDVVAAGVPPGVEVEETDRRLCLLGDTIPPGWVPRRNDAVTVREDAGDLTLYVVQALGRDPAAAVYTFLCRDRRGPDQA